MTSGQVQQLLSLLRSQNFGSHLNVDKSSEAGMVYSASSHLSSMQTNTWILDLEATWHIVCSLTLFSSYQKLHNRYVTLPDTSRVHVDSISTVHISPFLTLREVLYIPSFAVNLLSKPALLSNTNYTVKFFANHFFI